MTKLEEEILLAIDPLLKSLPSGIKAVESQPDNEYYVMTKAAAEVAKKYIEAHKEHIENLMFDLREKYCTEGEEGYGIDPEFAKEFSVADTAVDLVCDSKWLKENGIIE